MNTRNSQIPIRFLLVMLSLACCLVTSVQAQDPSIAPTSSSRWTNDDIWVVNADGDMIEPQIGGEQSLVARITNTSATSVPTGQFRVIFGFAPYGTWAWSTFDEFKQIGDPFTFSLGPNEVRTIQVAWELNAAENNGGLWGGLSVGDFDHFCVWVKIVGPDNFSSPPAFNTNTTNDYGMRNFVHVVVGAGSGAMPMKFMIVNPKNQQANGHFEIRGLPARWRPLFEGIDDPKRFALKPKEFRLVTLRFTPMLPAQQQLRVLKQAGFSNFPSPPGPITQQVDITLMLDGDPKPIGGISFDVTVVPEAGAGGGGSTDGLLSPYIIGTYDLRRGSRPYLHIVNPTGRYVRILVALFDDNEKPVKCLRDKLSPNDVVEIDLKSELQGLGTRWGVVKVVSLNDTADVPQAGVIGYQRTFSKTFFHGYRPKIESILQPIPREVLKDDWKFIEQACH